jgi:ubiquinone/menaquinone biosynthesis C-methylase UbiE
MGHVLTVRPFDSQVLSTEGLRKDALRKDPVFRKPPAVPHEPYVHSPVNLKKQVQTFWQQTPCDSWFADGQAGTLAFFRTLDEHRYRVHPKLLSAVDFEKTRGLSVLEIGCGCGSEAERFARAGARYTALDLTNAAVSVTQRRFHLAGLRGSFTQGDAENLPFADSSFDLVYSHGVLHHTPNTARAIQEVYRVLSPCGRAVIMLYHRNSFNYQINLRVIRRLRAQLLRTRVGLKVAQKIWRGPAHALRRHAELIQKDPSAYLDMQSILNRNTDGPDNPLSQVFSERSAARMFSQFRTVCTEVMFWNPNWLPVLGKMIPQSIEDKLAARWGWHLWIHAQKPLWDAPAPNQSCAPEHIDAGPIRDITIRDITIAELRTGDTRIEANRSAAKHQKETARPFACPK